MRVPADRLDRVSLEVATAFVERRRLPVIQPRDAADIIARLHHHMDRGTAARAEAIVAAGQRLGCGHGCTDCCSSVVVGWEAEAVTIARLLEEPEQAAAKASFLAAYPAWRARLAGELDAAARASAAGDDPGHRAALAAAYRRGVLCAFNHDGACTVYAVRPIVCRDAHALDTSADCAPGGSGEVSQLGFPAIEAFRDDIRPLVAGLHGALRPGGEPPEPLCTAVHRLLTRAP